MVITSLPPLGVRFSSSSVRAPIACGGLGELFEILGLPNADQNLEVSGEHTPRHLGGRWVDVDHAAAGLEQCAPLPSGASQRHCGRLGHSLPRRVGGDPFPAPAGDVHCPGLDLHHEQRAHVPEPAIVMR
jgi:hypothetical protein